MKIHDGLRLSLQFAANWGKLSVIAAASGIPKKRLEMFLDKKVELDTVERRTLELLAK